MSTVEAVAKYKEQAASMVQPGAPGQGFIQARGDDEALSNNYEILSSNHSRSRSRSIHAN